VSETNVKPTVKRNLAAKIVAVIVAAVLWLYVVNEQNPPIEASFTIPLEYQNLSPGLIVIDAPDVVRVKVRGPRSIISGVQSKDLKAYADMKDRGEGRHVVRITAAVPASLELVEINPDRINLRLEASVRRQFPLEIRTTGKSPPGVVVERLAPAPDTVTVEGAKSIVEAIARVVATVDLTDRSATFVAEVTPQVLTRDGREVSEVKLTPAKAKVSVLLTQQVKRTVSVKPEVVGSPAAGFVITHVTTEPEKIDIMGAKAVIEKIDAVFTEPVNVTGLDKDTTREVRLQIRPGLAVSQDKATVYIIVSPSRQKER